MAIRLIAGLGNPGPQYTNTRHNVGFWFIELLANQYNANLTDETKFRSVFAKLKIANQDCYAIMPKTFMNLSGEAVSAVAKYYKISAEEILIVHDELDLPVGSVKLKRSGGHGGHNGLRNIIDHLHTPNFTRLRIGIGRPTKAGIDHVLSAPSNTERKQIEQAMLDGLQIIPLLINDQLDIAMQQLHSKETDNGI